MDDIVSDSRHWTLDLNKMVGDTINLSISGDMLHIEIDEPWAGSTDTGFGATCSGSITRAQAQHLVDWLHANFLSRK